MIPVFEYFEKNIKNRNQQPQSGDPESEQIVWEVDKIHPARIAGDPVLIAPDGDVIDLEFGHMAVAHQDVRAVFMDGSNPGSGCGRALERRTQFLKPDRIDHAIEQDTVFFTHITVCDPAVTGRLVKPFQDIGTTVSIIPQKFGDKGVERTVFVGRTV